MTTSEPFIVNATSCSPEEALMEVIQEFASECRMLPGVSRIRVLFPDGDGFSDVSGSERVIPGEGDHPVLQAASTAQSIFGEWPGGSGHGVACPLRRDAGVEAVIWFSLDRAVSDHGESLFLLEAAVQRLARRMRRAAEAWSAERMRLALGFAEAAGRRFLTEVSLHRAMRLNITELAALADAREVSVWQAHEDVEPICISQVRNGSAGPQRDAAIERLVADLCRRPGEVRVLDTARSEHFAWCHELGVSRFLAYPIVAFDEFYGVLLLVDFPPRLPLIGAGPAPGVREASGSLAGSAAGAFFQIGRQNEVERLRERVQDATRRANQLERESIHFDLCRRASEALEDALAGLGRDLPGIEEPIAECEYRERIARLSGKTARGLEILEEFRLLTGQPPARLSLTNLNQLVNSVAEELRASLGTTASAISVRLQGDIPGLLLDRDKIRNVLVSLIRHGVSGTEQRQVVIATRLQKGEVVAEIRVPERQVPGGVLESLFIPFGQQGGGASGLSLADQIVHEHGGQLRAKSVPGEGLYYWLSLPVTANEERRRRRVDRRGRRDRRRREAA